ncbi:MAG: NAD(P)/FAD-dependent oxidoreductase [bacterium]|nr:NAD(P)/FAD-dependent oxidoreductase [bacterium]MCY3653184.1 NAD(P)/FAD-dependent oxidoreductase [bacterium]
MKSADLVIIGAGPAGAATAVRAARQGVNTVLFERSSYGRDKVCGDGLTPRAIGALNELDLDLSPCHRIDGLRMIAGKVERPLRWPETSRFPSHGGVWPRRKLDAALMDAAAEAGARVFWDTEALPVFEGNRVVGVEAGGQKWTAAMVVAATGAPGEVARRLGATRVAEEPYGVAIRSYVSSPRHAEHYIEACLSMRDPSGNVVPGYGWIFPAGDGTVNIGAGSMSTMKRFGRLNLNSLLDMYHHSVRETWAPGPFLERPRAWRLPMSTVLRHGPGWVAVGDAAGLVNPMNGEGIDYGLESGIIAADLFVQDPSNAPFQYDRIIGERFDAFLRTGRRFSLLIGHPAILRAGLKLSVSTRSIAEITLRVMGNLVDSETPGAAGKVLTLADRVLALAEPFLRRTRSRT